MRHLQVNLQPHFGGGEVFTAFLCQALSAHGIPTDLYVNPKADFWSRLGLPKNVNTISAVDFSALAEILPPGPGWLLSHGPLPQALVNTAKQRGWLVTAIAHMPVQGRNPRAYEGHDLIYPVSGWVLQGLKEAGLPAWSEPLYGVAHLQRRSDGKAIRQASVYDWDRRKFRDRLLGILEPLWESVSSHPEYQRRKGLTLGIVSRLTPIKQFPLMFQHLVPVLAEYPDVSLEIFGSGGYASVRDLRRVLKPLGSQVRYWGQQQDVASIYGQIDYLLTGLPEKEALGLNVIEAQACGTPVLAPRAAPFTETIVDAQSGFLFEDPRLDQGADFSRLLARLRLLEARPNPLAATSHLQRFSFPAMQERVGRIVTDAACRLQQRQPQ